MARLLYQGHGSYRITAADGTVVYIDPFAGKGYEREADLVLITHEHFDHTKTELITLKPEGKILRAVDFFDSRGYRTIDEKGITIQAVPAYNKNHSASECVGFVLRVDGKKIYCAGDTSETDYMSRQLSKENLDFALLPMDGVYNMGAEEASRCAKIIGAKHTIPVHMVPDAVKLFDEDTAYRLNVKGRLVIEPGTEIELEEIVSDTVNCREMKYIEKQAAESGLSYRKMMENAGEAAVKCILEYLEKRGKKVSETDAVIFCGKGNNGGDGYVAARLLAIKGCSVTVVEADGKPKTEDAIANANAAVRRGITAIDAKAYFDTLPDIVEAADVIVDAVYGTGFHGELSKTVEKCAKLINESRRPDNGAVCGKTVFALDIPSGLNGDLGMPDKNAVIADYTVAFHKKKPVHNMKDCSEYCGQVIIGDIGIDF